MDSPKKINMTREEYRNRKNYLHNIDEEKEENNETQKEIINNIEKDSF